VIHPKVISIGERPGDGHGRKTVEHRNIHLTQCSKWSTRIHPVTCADGTSGMYGGWASEATEP
jgi:hypothetical protein